MVFLEWAFCLMTVVSIILMIMLRSLLNMLRERQRESERTSDHSTTPVVGIPVARTVFQEHNDRPIGESDNGTANIQLDDIDSVQQVGTHVLKSLRNAGFYQEGSDRGFITMVMKTRDHTEVLAYTSQTIVNSVWVLVQDVDQLHLAKATNFKWRIREGGPTTRPNVVIGNMTRSSSRVQ